MSHIVYQRWWWFDISDSSCCNHDGMMNTISCPLLPLSVPLVQWDQALLESQQLLNIFLTQRVIIITGAAAQLYHSVTGGHHQSLLCHRPAVESLYNLTWLKHSKMHLAASKVNVICLNNFMLNFNFASSIGNWWAFKFILRSLYFKWQTNDLFSIGVPSGPNLITDR